MTTRARARADGAPWWRERTVWAAFAVALALRLALVFAVNHPFTDGLEFGYLDGAMSMASGRGLLQWTPDAAPGPRLDQLAMERQAAGGRIDAAHPFPVSVKGYLPATLHPPGYPLLLWVFYTIGNFDGMVRSIRFTSALLDAFVCVLLFLFVRDLFGPGPARVASWVWAFLPAPLPLLLTYRPDAFLCFFSALVLFLASRASRGSTWMWAATGATLGVAFYFRPEFLGWPALIFACAWIGTGRLWRSVAGTAVLCLALLALLSPWLWWTSRAVGRPMLGTCSAGGSMYEALGENPANPWGVTLNDGWVDADARQRGFVTVWSPQADVFYRSLFWRAVREHPAFWVRTLVLNRLPKALVPRYELPSGDQRFFDEYRRKEGLSRGGVLLKHPRAVLEVKGAAALMILLSAVLAALMPLVAVARFRAWRRTAWLVLPWLYIMGMMVFVKQVEARNVAGTRIVQAAAAGVLVDSWLARRRGRAAAPVEPSRATVPAA